MRRIDLRGQSFGRLRVLAKPPLSTGRRLFWPCRCDCGTCLLVRSDHLTAGKIVSCGCAKADPEVRQRAMQKVSSDRRRQIAQLGVAARGIQNQN